MCQVSDTPACKYQARIMHSATGIILYSLPCLEFSSDPTETLLTPTYLLSWAAPKFGKDPRTSKNTSHSQVKQLHLKGLTRGVGSYIANNVLTI